MRAPDNWRAATPQKDPEYWPPLDDHPKIGERIAEVRQLGERLATAQAKAEELRRKVEEAGQADKVAFADAVRNGGRRPKPSKPAAEAKHQEKVEEVDALERATAQSAREAFAAITEHGPAIVDDLQSGRLATEQQAVVDTIRELDRRREQVEETFA